MKKWGNPELMILGVEDTKEEIDTMDEKWPLHYCKTCGKFYEHDVFWKEHQHCGGTTPPEPTLS